MSRNNNNYGEQQPGGLDIRINNSGYRQYYDKNSESWKYTHRTVGERKIGRELHPNEQVHHINKDKTDNRYSNLVVVKDNIHREIHRSSYKEKNSCFRCGNDSHWSSSCYASYDIDGNVGIPFENKEKVNCKIKSIFPLVVLPQTNSSATPTSTRKISKFYLNFLTLNFFRS
ncbi:hypothetical protein RB653_006637 [Dictyostelium firmibasis]|uniref:HNH nuclease domain-containing protein n=1 Tax=Dictyostelium firmibasis TaxID=79012 RepID=A0AAN7TM50_9MYCE